MNVNISLGAFPGRTPQRAMEMAAQAAEPLLGQLSLKQVQICPQNFGQLTEENLDALIADHPDTQFRLHANVRITGKIHLIDLAQFADESAYFARVAALSRFLRAPAYTLHAGRRNSDSLQSLFDAAKAAADIFGCPVGVEGHYPTARNTYFLDSWAEHEALLQADVPFVIDLSHLNIIATAAGVENKGLVKDLLSSPNCLEIHLSGNDGSSDQHRILEVAPRYWDLLRFRNLAATVFSEGNQVRH